MKAVLPPKKDVALALLERSDVDVYLDPRVAGVLVPSQYRRDPRLILKVGLNMAVDIPDLRLDDEGMSCTLLFNRVFFFCVIPWPSVFAMVGNDGRGVVWPDDVPRELSVKVAEPPEPSLETAPKPRARLAAAPSPPPPTMKDVSLDRRPPRKRKKKDVRLTIVPAPAPEQELTAGSVDAAATSLKPKRELPPYLRVVK